LFHSFICNFKFITINLGNFSFSAEYSRNDSIPFQLWCRNTQTLRSKAEIKRVFQSLQNHYDQTANSVGSIKTLIKEKEGMENQFQNIQSNKE
jgi:hypothetical protein